MTNLAFNRKLSAGHLEARSDGSTGPQRATQTRRTGRKNRRSKLEEVPRMAVASGIAVLGERVIVWGKDLHDECLDLSFVHYYHYCATGRWFTTKEARIWERLWISTGYPDARLWCNRIAGYLGAARVDPGLCLSAAIAASNSEDYGFGALRNAYRLQLEIPAATEARSAWLGAELERKRRFFGYGRPVKAPDERLLVTYRILAEEGMMAGPALKRAYWLGRRLAERKGIDLNVAGAWSALAIDFGMNEGEFDTFMLLMLIPGYMAVYTDQRRREPLGFLAGYRAKLR